MSIRTLRRDLRANLNWRDAVDNLERQETARRTACQFRLNEGDIEPREALRATRGLPFAGKIERLEAVDILTGCHGVESFESVNGFWSYANSGDTYAQTVLLSPGGRFVVASYGDILEQATHDAWARRHNR